MVLLAPRDTREMPDETAKMETQDSLESREPKDQQVKMDLSDFLDQLDKRVKWDPLE